MWKRALLIALVASVVSPASEARQSTLELSCEQARALVKAEGAIVLSTGRYTYNRFVSRRSYCLVGEYADRGWAPTATGRCRLGFVCRPGDRLFDD